MTQKSMGTVHGVMCLLGNLRGEPLGGPMRPLSVRCGQPLRPLGQVEATV